MLLTNFNATIEVELITFKESLEKNTITIEKQDEEILLPLEDKYFDKETDALHTGIGLELRDNIYRGWCLN